MSDFRDDPAWKRWEKERLEELVPKLGASGAAVMTPGDDPYDIEFALQLGLSIMMDKPILTVILPGMAPPSEKLRLISDVLVEADLATDDGKLTLQEAIQNFIQTRVQNAQQEDQT